MIWFASIFFSVCILFFIAMILVIKMNQRREVDPVYDEKVMRIYNKLDPYYNFIATLVVWALALYIVYLSIR
jgi:hypothetical protein